MTNEGGGQRILSRENILSLYLPAVVLSLGAGIATPALPVFAKSFEISFGVATLIVIVSYVGSLAATIPTGYLVDRVGRKSVLLAGPMLTALSSFLTATAQSFPELLAYRFIGGVAQQMWMLARLAIIADTGAAAQRGRQITGMVSMEQAGRLLAPALGGFVAAGWDIRVPFVMHGILSLVAIIPSFKLVRETAPSRVRAGTPAEGNGTQTRLSDLLIYPVVMLFVAQLFASLTRGVLWGGTLDIYAVYAYEIGPATLGVMATIAGVTGIPITLTAGFLMDHFGRKASVVPGFALLSLWLAVMAGTAAFAAPFLAFVGVYLLAHAAQSLTSGNMQTIGSDVAPPHLRGRFFGVWRLVGEIGTLASPVTFALLAEFASYGAAFVFLSVSSLLAALVIATQIRETLGRSTPRPAGAERLA